MLEVLIELKLNSFLVNSTGDSSGLPVRISTKALSFSCEKILSARHLTEIKSSSGFDFLGDSGNKESKENKVESAEEFNNQLIKYFASHSQIDISKSTITYGDRGYCSNSKDDNRGVIGRLSVKEVSGKNSMDVELVLKQEEFDVIWDITSKQNITKMYGTFVCFRLKPAKLDKGVDIYSVAGILSSSLQMIPNA